MERTWIGSKNDNGNFCAPIFQYNHWIVHDGTRYSPDRTTNVAEEWNKRFNKSTGKKPTLLRFSESLHSEIAMIRQTVAEIDRTPQPLPSDKEIRLAQLLNQYGYLSTVEYFDRIGEIFSKIDFSYLS
uniref:Uncharacterized protein n=1 Tax=Acrobeloides nanus TaxID=290746 RepID=A0A914E055_9BILA